MNKQLNYLLALLVLFNLVLFNTSLALADLPDFSIKLEAGCRIHSGYVRDNNSAENYQAGNWVIRQIKKNNNVSYLNEIKQDYANYLNKKVTINSEDKADEIKSQLLQLVVNNFSEIVQASPTPLPGAKLEVLTLCDRVLPSSYPGANTLHTYTDSYKKNYNAPLELADLRLTLGMETLVVIEYLPNNSSNIKVVNQGLSDLHRFNLSLNGVTHINSNIASGSFNDESTNRKLKNVELTTEELSGLKLFPVKLVGNLNEN